MISNKNVANAVGGKTARACDSCIRKRARWYCAADDAFLCQACDSSVHSANPLACRHERVRLKTSSLKSLDIVSKETSLATSWHRGFTRKARTPRHGKPVSHSKLEDKLKNQIVPFVPELGSDEISHEDNEEEQLLYRVPIFDPFVAELCTSATVSNEAKTTGGNDSDQKLAYANGIQSKDSLAAGRRQDVDSLHGFLPSDTDLADFAADVESLLGRDLVNESFRMEELELVDCKEEQLQTQYNSSGRRKVKLEVEEINEEEEEEAIRECQVDAEIDMGKEPPFELSFDSDSATCGDEDENMKMKNNGEYEEEGEKNKKKNKKNRKILLRLDYEAVISAWASQGSPWTNGNRPEVDPDECWPDWMGNWGVEVQHVYGETGGGGGGGVGGQYGVMVGGGGREARVSRYREKRRTRLFSKKIRYEVRKLNAEKRPRMKGRFVKRATFASPTFSLHSK